MANLHLFNPGHDMALAEGKRNFTPPAAAVRLADGLAFIPAFWADDGDAVCVQDKKGVCERAQSYRQWMAEVEWLQLDELKTWLRNQAPSSLSCQPWGWDASVWRQWKKAGVPEAVMPSAAQLDKLRTLSGRATAVDLLRDFRQEMPWAVGETGVIRHLSEMLPYLMEWGSVVLKSPWSCSGRGVRIVHHDDAFLSQVRQIAALSAPPQSSTLHPLLSWAQRILDRQGYLAVEKYLDKVLDFAMEFHAHPGGEVEYCGLSVFNASNGAYTGNVVASEEDKLRRIAPYLTGDTVRKTVAWMKQRLGTMLKGVYEGPFGVDMMLVNTLRGVALNPCVEINLRRTMGHLAIALYQRINTACSFYIANYQLHIIK